MRVWFIDNLAIKIGALLIALFLWFHAVTEKEYEVRRQVPIQITAIPNGLVLAKPVPAEAHIRLKGKGKQLIAPYFSRIRLTVRADGAKKGTKQINLSPEHVNVPHGRGTVVAEILSTRKLELEFDSLIRKRVPVQSRITVEPSQGFAQVGPFTFNPDSVSVQGPSQYVKPIEFVTTDSANFSDAKKSIADVLSLVVPEGFNVTCVPQQIETTIEIQRLVQRTIDDIPVTLTNVPKGISAQLEPDVISITISGGEEYLSSLTKEDFSVFADYLRARRDPDNRINARVNLPLEVELTGAEPQMFKVITGS